MIPFATGPFSVKTDRRNRCRIESRPDVITRKGDNCDLRMPHVTRNELDTGTEGGRPIAGNGVSVPPEGHGDVTGRGGSG